MQDSLLNILESSNKSVINATNNINKEFQMQNDFPIFMAVIDIAWFRPDIIPIESEVPTGIGAVAYLCLLYTSPSPRDGTSSRMPSSA